MATLGQEDSTLGAIPMPSLSRSRRPLGESQITNTVLTSVETIKKPQVAFRPIAESQKTSALHLSAGDAIKPKQQFAFRTTPVFRQASDATPGSPPPRSTPIVANKPPEVASTPPVKVQRGAFAVFEDVGQRSRASNNLNPVNSESVFLKTPARPDQQKADPAPQQDVVGQPSLMLPMSLSPTSPQSPVHVWFNSPMNTSVEITPYSKIYGLHPRLFHFDGNGFMQLTPMASAAGLPQSPLAPTFTQVASSSADSIGVTPQPPQLLSSISVSAPSNPRSSFGTTSYRSSPAVRYVSPAPTCRYNERSSTPCPIGSGRLSPQSSMPPYPSVSYGGTLLAPQTAAASMVTSAEGRTTLGRALSADPATWRTTFAAPSTSPFFPRSDTAAAVMS